MSAPTERDQMLADIKALREALRLIMESYDYPCWFDHHGDCQTHFLDSATDGCRVVKSRADLQRTAKWEEA